MDTMVFPGLLNKVPLAEAVWLLWNEVFSDKDLDAFYESCRQRCYERVLSFSNLVHLVSDALCQHDGSGAQSLMRHDSTEQVPVSEQAFYGKLRRIPIALSEAFLADGVDRLRPWLPKRLLVEAPTSLRNLRILIFDGKTFKHAAKRLKPVRTRKGKGLGGRALVALEMTTGLLVGMVANPDAHVNEAKLVPQLLPSVRRHIAGPRLWVADRGFGDLAQVRRCTEEGDQCVIRLHKKSRFTVDPQQSVRRGVDHLGRKWVDEVGTLKSTRQGEMAMRRITLTRDGQPPIEIITSLLDGDSYPANDLLDLYKKRWGIEQAFQQVSEVFHLRHLIGSSPNAIIFQGALCMTLYNLLLVVRAIVADTQNRPISTISTFNLCYDLKRELTVLHHLLSPDEIVDSLRQRAASIKDLRAYLYDILHRAWTDRWIKSKPKKRHLSRLKHNRGGAGHFSIHRVLVESKEAKDV